MKTPLLTSLFLLCSALGFAQLDSGQPAHTLSAQFGYGWFGLLNNDRVDGSFTDNETGVENAFVATVSGSPATTIAYDYRFGRVFSLGGAVGHQALRFRDFRNDQNEDITGRVKINRVFLSARTLFHYGRNPKWDLYSGVRVGATVWGVSSTLERDDFTFEQGRTIKATAAIIPHLVPIPFGVKYYPNEKVMIGGELAFGSPHVVAFQVGIRI